MDKYVSLDNRIPTCMLDDKETVLSHMSPLALHMVYLGLKSSNNP